MTETTQQNTDDRNRMPSTFTPVTEHPLPFDQDAVDELVRDHPQFEDDADVHIDELHCDYVNRISKNHEWVVFEILLYGYDGVYIWNTEFGEGLRMNRDEWEFGSFAQVLALAQKADPSASPDDPPVTPNDDGCPYCEGGSDAMSSSLRPSGSYKQRCDDCGRSRMIG